MNIKLIRHPKNPIIKPSKLWWENKVVFNPGVAVHQGRVVLMYRAVGDDNISRLGFAESEDGVEFDRFDLPRYDPPINDPYERLGAEDPRITPFGENYFILYTATSVYSAKGPPRATAKISISKKAPFRIRVGVVTTKHFRIFRHHPHLFGGLDTKNAALFPEKIGGKFYIIHRVFPNITLACSPDFHHWRHETIVRPRPQLWDALKVGVGSQPISTRWGWLIFYHAVAADHNYHLGILVLDRDHPERVCYRSGEPILSPERDYETKGFINNVVFTCGAVEFKGQYHVYYGAADSVIGLATVPVETIDRLLGHEIGPAQGY